MNNCMKLIYEYMHGHSACESLPLTQENVCSNLVHVFISKLNQGLLNRRLLNKPNTPIEEK